MLVENWFLTRVKKEKILSGEEQEKLLEKYRDEGCIKSLQAVICSCLRLVLAGVQKYSGYASLQELLNVGTIGLYRAVELYTLKRDRPTKSGSFSTYARFWIRTTVQRFITKIYTVSTQCISKADRVLFTSSNESRIKRDLYLEDSIPGSESVTPGSESLYVDYLQDCSASIEMHLIKKQLQTRLAEDLRSISEKFTTLEAEIYYTRLFAEEKISLQEIGTKFGISRERVRQVESKLLTRHRKKLSYSHELLEVYTKTEQYYEVNGKYALA